MILKVFTIFGTSKHYDIISFLQELFRIDFKTAINKLSYDFGIIDYDTTSKELKRYLIERKEEEMQMKKNLDNWFNITFSKLCDELYVWQRVIPHIRGEALAIAYKKEQYLDYLIDIFINATEDDKVELWKEKEEIEECLNL